MTSTTTSRTTQPSRKRRATTATSVIALSLKTMSKRLRDARHGELSEKPLHELRIACRRAEAALRLCEDAADSKAWRWLTRSLKSLRRTCNQARDADVLEDWLKRQTTPTGQSLRRVIRHHRRDIEPEIRKLASGLCEHRRFARRSAKLISRLQACEASGQIAVSFGRRLFDEVHRFVKSLAVGRDEASKLHRLRIAGKRLRYGSELVTEIWPDVELTELKEHLHSLQDWLGAIQDQVVGERLLKKYAPSRSAKAAQTLARKARNSAARQQRKFWTWWRACPLERMLADTTAEVLTLMAKDR